MRSYRMAIFVGWLIVSSLAIAGFAAFSADDDATPAGFESPQAQVSPDVGRSAGSVAAMTFALLAEGARAGAPNPSAALPDPSDSTTSSTVATSSTSGGVVDRSTFFDEAQVRELVQQHFQPSDVSRAIRIAWCESSFNPSSVNPVTGASGLFQHDPSTWTQHSVAAGYGGFDILDPEANVAVAAWMLYELPGGWTQWECQA